MLIASHSDLSLKVIYYRMLQNTMYQTAIGTCIILEFYQQTLLTLINSPSSGRDPESSLCFARNKNITLRSQPLKIDGSVWVPIDSKFAIIFISPLHLLF